ncbi:hypothetical protein FA95DRAFT_1612071 [Auriscalpium vulgare]|uniref:Uncharacterized protein n=1 Tax=Auriscalpium vulgare TaxID=40419 RepID=A0ACB8R847_9AGAM|nr:hypothetical protein FA95DRAFT_1612071 [Auriscalpium vulgare]
MPRAALQDLPLDRFLPPPTGPNIPARPASPFKHPGFSQKRPLSPSASSVPFSPAKRRILEQEGLLSPPKSPLSGGSSGRYAPTYFHALVSGPDSPSRRLDFGAAKGAGTVSRAGSSTSDSSGPATPPPSSARSRASRTSPATPTKHTRTSPRLAASQTVRIGPSPPPRTPKARAARIPSPSSKASTISPSQSRTTRATSPPPMLVPRELPPRPDPQSVHHPGFDVHLDTHIVLPSTRDKEKRRDKDGEERDIEKENVPPRRTRRESKDAGVQKAEKRGVGSPGKEKATPRRSARLSAGLSESKRRDRRRSEQGIV